MKTERYLSKSDCLWLMALAILGGFAIGFISGMAMVR